MTQLVPIERVEKLILLLRGGKVLLGQQLAELYGVPTKVLIQAVQRNRNRFAGNGNGKWKMIESRKYKRLA